MSEREKPLLKKVLETGVAAGAIGIIIGFVSQSVTILHPALALMVGSFVGKKVAYQ